LGPSPAPGCDAHCSIVSNGVDYIITLIIADTGIWRIVAVIDLRNLFLKQPPQENSFSRYGVIKVYISLKKVYGDELTRWSSPIYHTTKKKDSSINIMHFP